MFAARVLTHAPSTLHDLGCAHDVGKELWRRVADADAPNAGKPATPEQLVRFRMARDWDKAARGVARHGAMEHPSAD